MTRILGIAGSLRGGSYSRIVLKTLQDEACKWAQFQIFDLAEVPLYNADLDGDSKPPAVKSLKEAIEACDGLILVSPEYNYGMSGVLKNALDWASRPGYQSVLKDKPVIFITQSPASTGGVRSHAQIRQTLAATLSILVPGPEVAIPSVDKKIKDGKLVDQMSLNLVRESLQSLQWWIESRPKLAHR
jgi:chromate reductase